MKESYKPLLLAEFRWGQLSVGVERSVKGWGLGFLIDPMPEIVEGEGMCVDVILALFPLWTTFTFFDNKDVNKPEDWFGKED